MDRGHHVCPQQSRPTVKRVLSLSDPKTMKKRDVAVAGKKKKKKKEKKRKEETIETKFKQLVIESRVTSR